jgi:hypothetical protein
MKGDSARWSYCEHIEGKLCLSACFILNVTESILTKFVIRISVKSCLVNLVLVFYVSNLQDLHEAHVTNSFS